MILQGSFIIGNYCDVVIVIAMSAVDFALFMKRILPLPKEYKMLYDKERM